jgi:hypothetical protein
VRVEQQFARSAGAFPQPAVEPDPVVARQQADPMPERRTRPVPQVGKPVNSAPSAPRLRARQNRKLSPSRVSPTSSSLGMVRASQHSSTWRLSPSPTVSKAARSPGNQYPRPGQPVRALAPSNGVSPSSWGRCPRGAAGLAGRPTVRFCRAGAPAQARSR